MKRLFLTVAMIGCIFAIGYAQKSNLSKAKNRAQAETPDFDGAIEAINAALLDSTTKDLAETYYVAGLVYQKIAEAETNKQMIGQQADVDKLGKAALTSMEYFPIAYEKDFLPNEKGKVKPKNAKKIVEIVRDYYMTALFANYGAQLFNDKNFEQAFKAFEMHTLIPDMEMIKKSDEPIIKDSVYYQIKYYAAVCANLMENNKKAAEIYEEIKDKSGEGDKIYQYLYTIYSEEKDTANFVRILKEGYEAYPQEPFFLGTLINYLIFNNQVEEGLAYLNQAIENDPKNAEYCFVKGSVMEVLDKPDAAIEFFEKAIELNPQHAAAWGRKGAIVMKQAMEIEENAANIRDSKLYEIEKKKAEVMFKEALPLFEKAIELDPNDRDNLRILRGLYYRFKDMKNYDKITEMLNNL